VPAGADATTPVETAGVRDRAPIGALRRRVVAALLLCIAALPMGLALLALAAAWFDPQPELWQHLLQHVVGAALVDTAVLVVAVAVLSTLLGSALAALVVLAEFPARRWLEIGLVLPLALPAYVLAFVYVASIDAGSPLRALASSLTGNSAWLPSIRNPAGAALVLTLACYPYAYLLVRAALLRQGRTLYEAARALGHGPRAALACAVLPALRPALAAGFALAALEALADFGAVAVLGVDTLSVAIYKAWYGLGSLALAAQLAGSVLLVAVALSVIERRARGRAAHAAQGSAPFAPERLRSWRAVGASAFASGVMLLGFVLPVCLLAYWSFGAELRLARLGDAAWRTLLLAGGGTVLIVMLGAALATVRRTRGTGAPVPIAAELAQAGYAVPGTVLAVALMLPLIALERSASLGSALSSGAIGVWLALVARFLRVGAQSIDAGLAQVRPSLVDAARTLGAGPLARMRLLYLPLLRPALGAGLLLAFVECAKELPATLMLRPIGWDTLAILIYNSTSEGLWREAAAPALLLVVLGLVPALALLRRPPP
jgi:iron(III) transport system permease protein